MEQHTKSPWAWQNFGGQHCLTAQHGDREIIISANKDRQTGIPFASMNKDGRLQPIDPKHPNAVLIAASPDLLEALQWAIEEIKILSKLIPIMSEYNMDTEQGREAWGKHNGGMIKIENAIKKALPNG